jgi:hypothetical protein
LAPIVAWSFVLGFVTAAGMGVYHFVRYRPRCTILSPGNVRHRFAGVEVWDVSELRRLWRLTSESEARFAHLTFTPDGEQLAYRAADRQCERLDLVDPPSGLDRWLEERWPNLFGRERPGISVIDTDSGRECFRLMKGADCTPLLSEDGSTLVTVHGQLFMPIGGGESALRAERVQVWEVSPRRALIGSWLTALGLAAALWLVRLARRRRLAARAN